MTSTSLVSDIPSSMINDLTSDVDASQISFTSTQEWEDMLVVSQQGLHGGDLLSDSSHHSEAAQVFQTWQSEEEDVDTYGIDMMDSEMDDDNNNNMNGPGVVSDDDHSSDEAESDSNDDIIMQLTDDDDEGLLPSNLDDFYDSLAKEILMSSGGSSGIGSGSTADIDMLLMLDGDDDCGEQSLTSVTATSPAFVSSHSSSSRSSSIGGDSFFAGATTGNPSYPSAGAGGAMNDQKTRFDATVRKLAESMRRSQESRRSLYARSAGLDNYKRLPSVQKVLQSIEFSTRHVDSYCRRAALHHNHQQQPVAALQQ